MKPYKSIKTVIALLLAVAFCLLLTTNATAAYAETVTAAVITEPAETALPAVSVAKLKAGLQQYIDNSTLLSRVVSLDGSPNPYVLQRVQAFKEALTLVELVQDEAEAAAVPSVLPAPAIKVAPAVVVAPPVVPAAPIKPKATRFNFTR